MKSCIAILFVLPALGFAPLPSPAQDGFAVSWKGVDALLVDEKDQGLLQALHMLRDRFQELPAEIGQPESVGKALLLGLRMLHGPLDLRAGYWEGESETDLPIYLQLDVREENAEGAAVIGSNVVELLQTFVPQVESHSEGEGLYHLEVGPAIVHHGAVGDAFVLAMGRLQEEPLNLAAPNLPDGVKPALVWHLNTSQYMAGLEALLSHTAGPEAEKAISLLRMITADGLEMTAAMGVGADRSYSAMTIDNFVERAEATVGMPSGGLSRKSIAMVPQDSLVAALGVTNFSGTLDWLVEIVTNAAGGEEAFGGRGPLEMLQDVIGLHLARDLVDHLGEEWGVFLSDSTGGGGLGSAIAFLELDDAPAFKAGVDRLVAFLNAAVGTRARGYVQIRRSSDVLDHYALIFPGLPIPVELCAAEVGGFFLLSLNPQALFAASEHVRSSGSTLLDNPRFQAMSSGSIEGLFGLSFADVPRLLADGYGWSVLGSSLLSNATRSPSDPERNPPAILPTFNELARGAKASVSETRLVEGDLVTLAQMDRSMLVLGTGQAGLLDRMPLLIAIPAMGAIGGAVTAARVSEMQATLESGQDEHEQQDNPR